MNVGILIISHDQVGAALLKAAQDMIGNCPFRIELISVSHDTDPEDALEQARQSLTRLEQGMGVIVLTDIYGSTPSNIATRLDGSMSVRVITGINLPMLVRLLNYPGLELDDLVIKAVSGGKDGVLQYHAP